MIYDTLKSLYGSASLINLEDASRLQRQQEALAEIEAELETLEAELAEWESACGFWDEDAA